MSSNTRIFPALFILVLTLSSCGGNGSSEAKDDPPAQSLPGLLINFPQSSTGSAAKVSQVVTPMGSYQIGAKVQTPPLDSGTETIAFANDKDGNLIFATLISKADANPQFTAETTALAVARLMIGPLPDGVGAAQLNQAIRTAPDFPNLVLNIDNAHKAGSLPQDYPGFAKTLASVLDSALASTKPASGTALNALRTGGLAPDRVHGSLPYVIESGLGIFKIRVLAGNTSVQGIDISNGFPIDFVAYGSTADGAGKRIPSKDDPVTGLVTLPNSKLYTTGSITAVPGTGQSWNLTVLQNSRSRMNNGAKVWTEMNEAVLSFAGLGEAAKLCGPTVSTGVLGSDSISPWATASDAASGWDGYVNFLSDSGTWKQTGEAIYECAKAALLKLSPDKQAAVKAALTDPSKSSFAWRMAPIYKTAASVMRSLNKAEAAYNTASLAATSWAFVNYWDYSKTVGICGRTDAQTVIGNCASSLSITPNIISITPGQTASFSIVALDKNGKETLVPQSIDYHSSDPSIAATTSPLWHVKGIKISPTPVTITFTDPITGATGAAKVAVAGVSAKIQFNPTSISTGEMATLKWSSEHADTCTASGAWTGDVATSGTAQIASPPPGSYDYVITCKGSGGPAQSSATLVVAQAQTGSVYKYVGPMFNSPYEISGRMTATVTFKKDLSKFTGTISRSAMSGDATFSYNNPPVQKVVMAVEGSGYTADTSRDRICWDGYDFNFKDGKITNWTLGLAVANPTCPVPTELFRSLQFATSSSGPGSSDSIWVGSMNTDTTLHGGIMNASAGFGTWTKIE